MDEIKNLRDKHLNVPVELLENSISLIEKQTQEVKHEEEQALKENEAKIEELMSEIVALKETLHTEHQLQEQKNEELLKHNDFVTELRANHNKLIEEMQNLEVEKNYLKTTKPNQRDQLLLQQGKEKLLLYKTLTGIQWDYSVAKERIEGYVSNNVDYIHHFSFTQNEKDPHELSDLLWKEIYLSIGDIGKEDNATDSMTKS